jgi:L-threonylcarbamoyladenylate synthase
LRLSNTFRVNADALDAAAFPLTSSRIADKGDLTEAAARLFGLLHDLDGLGVSRIQAELVPDRGLGPAINYRLCRAACKRNSRIVVLSISLFYTLFRAGGNSGT